MNDVLGLIMSSAEADLRDLTAVRPAMTLPFGGRYRLVDFALSNLVNAGIKKIGIFGTDKYRSLVDHVGTGQEWSLARKNQELLILQGGIPVCFNKQYCYINLQDIQENEGIFTRSQNNFSTVVISMFNTVCNIDIGKALERHEKNGAQVTFLTRKLLDSKEPSSTDILLDTDQETCRVRGISLDGKKPFNRASIGFLIINADLLFDAMKAAEPTHRYDLMAQLQAYCGDLRMYAEDYGGYFRRIGTIQDYYQANMDLLNPAIVDRLLGGEHWISTKHKDNPPTRYTKTGQAVHSLIASGCSIAGSVGSSVLFRQCTVGEGAVLQDSILLESCRIGRGTVLEYVICDRGVVIHDGVVLQGSAGNPVVIHKGAVI